MHKWNKFQITKTYQKQLDKMPDKVRMRIMGEMIDASMEDYLRNKISITDLKNDMNIILNTFRLGKKGRW